MRSLDRLRTHPGLIAITLVAALVACSDDDGPTGNGPGDTDPPEVSGVTPINGFQLELAFNEDVLKESAEDVENYSIVEQAPPGPRADLEGGAAPGDPVTVISVSLKPDNQTVALSTATLMGVVPYEVSVSDVRDVHGNQMTSSSSGAFTGTGTQDQTPPEIVMRTPAAGAQNVGITEPVVIQFSEMVFPGTVANGFSWTHDSESVVWEIENLDEADLWFSFTPVQPMDRATSYTIALTGVSDRAGNQMSDANWSFTTTSAIDQTPPTLVSSSPSHLATNVSPDAILQLTFSEAIVQIDFEPSITPEVGDGIVVWSNGGRTITFEPDLPLLADTQYYLAMIPGDIQDLSGNTNTVLEEILFTTGSSFASGSIEGTVSGDPGSDFADNPSGAVVVAADSPPFEEEDDFGIGGGDIVGSNGSYALDRLADGVYYPVSAMDSNGDGEIDPDEGDAVGAYGIDLGIGDTTPEGVPISGGSEATGIDFRLFDPSAIVGSFSYEGIHTSGYYVRIGAFDAATFDPSEPPLFGTQEYWPSNSEWSLSSFEDELDDGSYIIAAFLDLNHDTVYDPEVEPAGIYGGSTPTTIVITRGSDALGVHIVLEDPNGMTKGSPVAWPDTNPEKKPWAEWLGGVIREAAAKAD